MLGGYGHLLKEGSISAERQAERLPRHAVEKPLLGGRFFMGDTAELGLPLLAIEVSYKPFQSMGLPDHP